MPAAKNKGMEYTVYSSTSKIDQNGVPLKYKMGHASSGNATKVESPINQSDVTILRKAEYC